MTDLKQNWIFLRYLNSTHLRVFEWQNILKLGVYIISKYDLQISIDCRSVWVHFPKENIIQVTLKRNNIGYFNIEYQRIGIAPVNNTFYILTNFLIKIK